MNKTKDLLRYRVCKAIGCTSYSEASNWCTGLTCGWDAKMIFQALEKQGYNLVKTEEHFGCFLDLEGEETPTECVFDIKEWSQKDCAVAMNKNITDKTKCKYWQKYFLTI